MKKLALILCVLSVSSVQAKTLICPSPDTSSLAWGEVPAPWKTSPFSQNTPQGEEGTRFVKANVLVAGMGRGAMCTYQNSLGYYAIWWEGSVKIPSPFDFLWRRSLGGFECTESIEDCAFFV